MSASRLYEFSKVLGIPVNFFFENYGSNENHAAYGMSDNDQAMFEGEENVMNRKETMELIRVYYSIQSPKLRKDLFKIVKSMAQNLKDQES